MTRQVALDRDFDMENLHAMAQIVISKAYHGQDRPPKEIIPFLNDLATLIPADLKAHLDNVIPALKNGIPLTGPCPITMDVEMWPWDRVMDELHHYIWMYEYHDAMTHGDLRRAVRADEMLNKIEQDQGNRYTSAMIHGPDLHEYMLHTMKMGWRIKGIKPISARLIVIYGAPGDFKTFVALDMLVHIAADRDWHGHKVQQCGVVYVAAEGGAGILKRIAANTKYNGIENLENFYLIPLPCILDDNIELNQFIAAVKPLKPGVICFDTTARCMIGDENSTQDMNKLVNACTRIIQELDCQVVLIHHTGKDESRGARGSIALTGASDAMFRVKAFDERKIALICERQKDHETFQDMIFDMEVQPTGYADEDLQPINSLVPVYDPDATPQRPKQPLIKGQTRTALSALDRALEDSGEYPSSEVMAQMDASSSRGKVVHEDAWRQYAYKMGISDKSKKAMQMAFNRARAKLTDENMIGCWDGFYWKTDKVTNGNK